MKAVVMYASFEILAPFAICSCELYLYSLSICLMYFRAELDGGW